MKSLRAMRPTTRARTQIPSDKSAMTIPTKETQIQHTPLDSNGSSNDVVGRGSSKTKNLDSTETTSQASSNSRANSSAATATTNGKEPNSTYIPPVHSREHNTRSKNGVRKETKPIILDSPENTKVDNELEEMIEEIADQLARVDDEAYRREQTRDTNSILSQLVLPMALPWAHRIQAFRAVSHDIDDLEGIIEYEDEFPGESRIGEVRESRMQCLPEHHAEAARRSSEDPGVIEYTRFCIPRSFNMSTEPTHFMGSDVGSETIGEGVAVGFIEEIERRKRRRVEIIEENTEKLNISICFGGTSSRLSLQPKNKEALALQAKLPHEIHGGRRMDALRAAEEAFHLGSYDHRHGLPRPSDSTKRVRTGRTRLVWTSKQSMSQRSLHKSILTGTLLENGQQRRPTDVKVLVRYNGCLLTSENGRLKKVVENEDNDEWAGAHYTNTMVESAFKMADERESEDAPKEKLQCSFDSATYLEHVNKKSSSASQFIKRTSGPYSVRVFEKDQLWLNVRPPILWSQPSEDGVFQVICSERGELKGIQYTKTSTEAFSGPSISKAYPWATAVLLDAMAKQHQACCICWSDSDSDGGRDLMICAHCNVQVHPKCYHGKKALDPKWCCDSCTDYIERSNSLPASLTPRDVRWARVCRLCPHYGSAISRHQISTQSPRSWVHHSCRVWQRSNAFEEGLCVICSKRSDYLVRCGATGCSILFHPMCARIASHAAAVNQTCFSGKVELEEDRDIFLCTQYCQEAVTVSFGKKKSAKRSIPIAYCGFHNPQRARDRYGLQPGAIPFKEAVRLPMKRDKK